MGHGHLGLTKEENEMISIEKTLETSSLVG
jgi:hypothetical protein